MPQFDLPDPRRYNTLRLLGYDYNSIWQLCAISLVADPRPLFADVILAKSVLNALLSDQTLEQMRVRAFTLMPNHLHFLARNDLDLQENLDYIAMNPVRAGYVTRPEFYPYTGFLY